MCEEVTVEFTKLRENLSEEVITRIEENLGESSGFVLAWEREDEDGMRGLLWTVSADKLAAFIVEIIEKEPDVLPFIQTEISAIKREEEDKKIPFIF